MYAFHCRLFALGVTMYGQMTAGSYCYIGPQVSLSQRHILRDK
jgi:urocanate hydratase